MVLHIFCTGWLAVCVLFLRGTPGITRNGSQVVKQLRAHFVMAKLKFAEMPMEEY